MVNLTSEPQKLHTISKMLDPCRVSVNMLA
jgi:hypothetical protein